MNAEVVTVCSRIPMEPYYHYREMLESLHRFGEVPTVLGMNEEWRGLMTKPFLLRNWLREGRNRSDRLIVCDAFDIIFVKHPHGIGDECAELFGDGAVFNGEKGCWPREDLRPFFVGESPWRFLNSGFMCGPAAQILKLLDAMKIEEIGFDPPGGPYPNDQGEYQLLYVNQEDHGVSMYVDEYCELAQTGSACTLDEFDLSGPLPVNRLTGTTPGVWHFNGDSKSNGLMDAILEKLNIH